MLARDDKYVWRSRVKAEISAAYRGNKKLTSYDKVSAAIVVLQCVSLCTAAVMLGIMAASSPSYLDVIMGIANPADSLIARACLFALTVLVATLVINSVRHGVMDDDSRIFVLNEGPRRVADSDVRVVAQSLNIEPTDIVHVNLHRVVNPDEGVRWR
ncbi:hypothetical protein ANAPH2_01086 [Anaplasma phagocytophilum]|nr:hypothetical protein ANAPH2_01086 [Anaplasma phagocytophilum]